ncbi:hypothetical protein [Biomaibacter acetigenes]|uniref:hypothetical protein n=1 Tax=Biomaibacter acetigenes TaxID=2316383 RepID=UPI0013CF01A7|nr:hypothetical protein [Biomaibacter acetigenes]
MPFGIEISFPAEPTKEDLKELRRQVAHDMFQVIDGNKEKDKKPKENYKHQGK